MFDGFQSATATLSTTTAFYRVGGSGPPLVLLHGFPETHLMWRDVAPLLARHHTIICPDLRGYGQSGCPASAEDHAPYSKRAMAADIVELMGLLGFPFFDLVGHDRGGRVAYRLALDHPDRVARLALLDIVPTEAAWAHADDRFALAFWPWVLLAQQAPLPERLIACAPDAIVEDAASGWGSPRSIFPPAVHAAYTAPLRDPAHAHAICEEYRAAAGIDRTHDQADLREGRRLRCPTLVLWSTTGGLGTWYEAAGGPLALWRPWCPGVEGAGFPGGHFFPEEMPRETAEALGEFFAASV
jgi:haloacetate dehalogenase